MWLKVIFNIFLFLFLSLPVYAQEGGLSLIRDTEIETTLQKWAAPLITAAGLKPHTIHIIVVGSPQINAFVAGGANVFIYTGLIQAARTPEEIKGVIAHELGHIAGGHLIAGREAQRRASYEAILATALGVAAAAISGDPQAALAAQSMGNQIALRGYLAHSRGQEGGADQAALTFMERARINPTALMTFLDRVGAIDVSDTQNAYMRTHPMNADRQESLRRRVEASTHKNTPSLAREGEDLERIRAKLTGFITPQFVGERYPIAQEGVPAHYARAIAAWRGSRVEEGLGLAENLIKREPQNPYFLELKGQMLFESGRAADAVPYYQKAVALLPKAGLLYLGLGHALLEAGRTKPAITELTRAVATEPRSPLIHRLLATAYGKAGQGGLAKLHLAEEALLQGKDDVARTHAAAALTMLPKGTPAAFQAADILAVLGEKRKTK